MTQPEGTGLQPLGGISAARQFTHDGALHFRFSFADGTEVFKHAQPLADGAFADLKAQDEIIQ